ncbi:TonB-dependent receptor [Silvibacterium dinghuense]|nr:TonB-dependent receptor [Silvibacterium dinghuense]
MTRQLRVLLVSIFIFGLGSAALAQNTQLQGEVSDSSGAVIPKALVRVVDQRTGTERKVETNGSGRYIVPGLDPSLYKVFVQAEGFSTAASTPITLNVGQSAVLDFKMQIGQATQSVTVDASGLQINTTDGSVGTVVGGDFVANLPLNGRSFQDLILLTPGVVTQTPQNTVAGVGTGGDFSVNGQRTESNSYIVDGVSANTSASVPSGVVQSSTALGTTQSLVSVDALQEFRVNSSTYSAEYGRTPGGQFSFITRSGTDDFHGSIFDYLRNNFFDANNWFTDYYHTKAPALRQNDFGGTLGGPITIPALYDGRDKSFFFVSYEGLRLTQPQPAVLKYVPDLALRQNPMLPAVMRPILNAFPLPTSGGMDYSSGLAQFIQSDSLPSQIDSTSIRLDQAVSSRMRLFFRFSDVPSSSSARNLSIYNPTTSGNHTYTLGATNQLNTNVTNEFRLGYVDSNNGTKYIMDNFGGAQSTDLAADLGANISPNPGPGVALSLGGNYTALQLAPTRIQMHQWNVTDTLSWLLGRHTFKFGIDYRYIDSLNVAATPSVFYLYTNASQLLSNSALSGTGTITKPNTEPRFREFSGFAQDEWRVRSPLSLSLGVRWDVNPSPSSGIGPLPYTLSGSLSDPAGLSLAPENTALYKTTWYNFAPRLGVAWTANNNPGYQTVFRAGGGVFFDTGNQSVAAGFTQSPGNFTSKALQNAPLPFPNLASLTFSLAPPYTSTVIYAPYPHLQLPYTLEWSSAVEQGLGQAQTLTISYVAANGRRLLQENEFSIHALNPNFGTIIQYTNGPTSNYQSLQTKFQRSVAHGVQALVAYTWSHSLDYGSNFTTLPLQRGNSDFDVRNNFTAGATWETPIVHRGMIIDALINEWAIDGHLISRSGFPVNILGSAAVDAATGTIYYPGVNLVPNQPLYLHITSIPGGREINKAAFTLPATGSIGTAPRNFVRGFGATQMNIAVKREFRLHDNLNLQFRAESFNSLNHPNFGTIDSVLTDTTFGQATNTLNQGLATTSLLYQMGGPRSMQFALKLQF